MMIIDGAGKQEEDLHEKLQLPASQTEPQQMKHQDSRHETMAATWQAKNANGSEQTQPRHGEHMKHTPPRRLGGCACHARAMPMYVAGSRIIGSPKQGRTEFK